MELCKRSNSRPQNLIVATRMHEHINQVGVATITSHVQLLVQGKAENVLGFVLLIMLDHVSRLFKKSVLKASPLCPCHK